MSIDLESKEARQLLCLFLIKRSKRQMQQLVFLVGRNT